MAEGPITSDPNPDVFAGCRRSTSVLVVEPHEIRRNALIRMLRESGPRLVPLDAVRHPAAGVAPSIRTRPDVVVVTAIDPADYAHVRDIVRRLPGTRVIVISLRSDGLAVSLAFRSGAAGFVPSWVPPEDIIDAIEQVSRGVRFVHPAVEFEASLWAAAQGDATTDEGRVALATLSAGEREVLDLLSEGLSPGMMATRLPLSRGTIESRLATAYQKLGAHDRLEATRVYRGLRDIDIDEPVRA